MNTIKSLALAIAVMFTITSCQAKIKNAKTETRMVYGNCDMCKKTIETAVNKSGEAKVVWDKNTKIATLTYDSIKTNADAILKKIAYAGYDNEAYAAPDEAYNKLHACCQYERKGKVTATQPDTAMNMKHDVAAPAPVHTEQPLDKVFAAYFLLKDALAKDDGVGAAGAAKSLSKAIGAVDMKALSTTTHTVWMKYQEKLDYDAVHIQGVTDLEHQREHFVSLSANMYEVMKVAKPGYAVYYDHCPMYNNGKGANWLSKESAIKNPFYGSSMPTCGKVIETIK
ncbi:MAG: DUF3347 domain-containing protein [Sphingobacteriales bacterium JAD_PAG50586_3]|nr:MAG: DUF3347 domain-containing protein [Sphingobacteriales bacterium JAD_PAG50586_3]